MKDMLKPGNHVVLHRDLSQDSRDRYGRLLRYIEKGGFDVGKAQVRFGWAKVYVYDRPFKRVGGYRDGQKQAKNQNRGVWDRCNGHFHQAE